MISFSCFWMFSQYLSSSLGFPSLVQVVMELEDGEDVTFGLLFDRSPAGNYQKQH